MTSISIICPLYNKKNYIEETIDSVIKQTVSDWELIIVDDGSTDGSYEIVNTLCQKEPRVKLLRRSDFNKDIKGANICRNIGIEQAKSEYVFFLDADDLLMPFCIAQRVSFVRENPGYHLYVFNVAYCKGADAIPYARKAPSATAVKKYKKAKDVRKHFLRLFLKYDLPWHTSGPLWHRAFFLSSDGFNPAFQRLQDPELHGRVLMNDKLMLRYAMAETRFDTLHRIDDDRVVWGESEFLKKRLDAITLYINTFVPIIEEKCPDRYIKYLQGYLIAAEKIVYRYIREGKGEGDVKWGKNILNVLYKEKGVQKVMDRKYRIHRLLYELFTKRLFIKTNITDLYLRWYKKMI